MKINLIYTNHRINPVLWFVVFGLIWGCKKPEPIEPDPDDIETYIHLAHPRSNTDPYMDPVVESLDFSTYDMRLLGGDLAVFTSKSDETMAHIDSVFDFGHPNTLWALGNHDYSNLNRVTAFTFRPNFYTYTYNGICFLVLDTQAFASQIAGDQLALLQQVTDTIQQASHLILLHHKMIWLYDHPELETQIDNISNAGLGSCFYCINPNNFYTDIYPELVEVKNRGIEVLCIGGDLGYKTKSFEYKTEEGIYLMGSGINYGQPDNQAILFEHNLTKGTLSWTYPLLTELE